MPIDLLPLAGFAFVSSITPGPNNTLLMLSGAHWGFRKSLPLVLGIFLGFSFMLFLVGTGLGNAFRAWPLLHLVLKGVSVVYLLWLAWKLARAGSPDGSGPGEARPLSFLAAASMQWINPKAWFMAVTAMSVYVPVNAPPSVPLFVTAWFMLAGFPCCLAWFFFGTALKRFLTNPLRVKAFNFLMALLLLASIALILF
jgi:threonine/homoserine/homoserine lactone efflux protein